jgi:hypothetical protein
MFEWSFPSGGGDEPSSSLLDISILSETMIRTLKKSSTDTVTLACDQK